jgi:hypothetical protein
MDLQQWEQYQYMSNLIVKFKFKLKEEKKSN